jgi:hypothetical protein
MTKRKILYKNEDNLIEYNGLQDAITLAYINDATLTYTLKSESDQIIDGVEDVSLPYVAASNGDYRDILDASVDLPVYSVVWLEITIDASGRDGFRRVECFVTYRDDT